MALFNKIRRGPSATNLGHSRINSNTSRESIESLNESESSIVEDEPMTPQSKKGLKLTSTVPSSPSVSTLGDIEDLPPCGKPDCTTFVPHIWKPDTCINCFKSRRTGNEGVEEKSAWSDYQDFIKWERSHKPQVELIKSHIMKMPIVENVMIKNITNLNSKDDHELVTHIILSEGYENFKVDKQSNSSQEDTSQDVELKQKLELISSKQQKNEQREEELNLREVKLEELRVSLQTLEKNLNEMETRLQNEKKMFLLSEKQQLESEKIIFEREKQMTMRELEVVKREKAALLEMKTAIELKEKESKNVQLQQDELTKLAAELQRDKQELAMKQQAVEQQKSAVIESTNKLKEMQEQQGQKNKLLEEKEKKLALEIEQQKQQQQLQQQQSALLAAQVQAAQAQSTQSSSSSSQPSQTDVNQQQQHQQQQQQEDRVTKIPSTPSSPTISKSDPSLSIQIPPSTPNGLDGASAPNTPQVPSTPRWVDSDEAKRPGRRRTRNNLLKPKAEDEKIKMFSDNTKGFQIWVDEDATNTSSSSVVNTDKEVLRDVLELEHPENDIFYYRDNFMIEPRIYEEIEQATKYFKLGRILQRVEPWHFYDHINLMTQNENGTNIISLRKTPDPYANYLGILRSKANDEPFSISSAEVKKSKSAEVSTRDLIAATKKRFTQLKDCKLNMIECKKDAKVKEAQQQSSLTKLPKFLPEDLLDLDRKLKVRSYKFAVIYAGPGQTKAEQILKNKDDIVSKEFYIFMNSIAEKIKMKGWKGYKADLDVKTNTTCTHSYYTEWNGLEVMFHVAPMLDDSCRDRIIGNDVVAIIWQEGDSSSSTCWDPSTITSQVLHAQIVIRPVMNQDGTFKLKLGCAVKDGVPRSKPKMISKLWDLDDNLRDFLLAKCVNSERASWHCTTTVRSQSKSLKDHLMLTREGQLSFIFDRHIEQAKEVNY
eukprot:TRINITY_DN9539_c0_g1_i1.p1 TRINITY_DN9539_c0_g1~~TRINITY_DN9539_c0_g1_i1.p1  ORF type:complete len:938 (-),score=316.35 TRINITY_DN9539_c0_g1_i1:244-3057(-)